MTKALEAAFLKRFPDRLLNLSHAATFEAVLIALDAYKRAGSTEPAKLIEALRKTDLKDNTSIGPGVRFNDKGQCPDTRIAGIQNRGGKNVIVVPVAAANAKPIWPQRPWRERG
jgi:branched-chain amino acid transport system substrate-binding protein